MTLDELDRWPDVYGREGIFLVTLDAEGRCTEFRNWWNSRSRPIDA